MMRHVVLFRWKPDTADDVKATVSAGLDKLVDLPSVAAYKHGPDMGISDGNWDYVVVGDFESVDDYQAYATNDGHVALINDHIKPNIEARSAVQYEL